MAAARCHNRHSFQETTVLHDYLSDALHKIYAHIEHDAIKQSVDAKGIDKFVNECASLAAVTGAVTGLGGAFTAVVGVPVDIINNVTQQFRVTLAVIYSRRGEYERLSFDDFMKIVAISLGVEIGAILTRQMLVTVATAILAKMTISTAARIVPVFASVIGGSVNFLFIKGMAEAVRRIDLDALERRTAESLAASDGEAGEVAAP